MISRSQTQKSIIQICKKGEQFYSEPGILMFSGYLFCQHKPSRSKVRFAPTPFYAYGRKRRHPHAPLLLLSKLNPLRWASIWGFSFSRTSYRSRRRFFFQNNRHRSFTSSLLFSKLEPLCRASIWDFFGRDVVDMAESEVIWCIIHWWKR